MLRHQPETELSGPWGVGPRVGVSQDGVGIAQGDGELWSLSQSEDTWWAEDLLRQGIGDKRGVQGPGAREALGARTAALAPATPISGEDMQVGGPQSH